MQQRGGVADSVPRQATRPGRRSRCRDPDSSAEARSPSRRSRRRPGRGRRAGASRCGARASDQRACRSEGPGRWGPTARRRRGARVVAPPTTRTRPSCRSVAVWPFAASMSDPVGLKDPLAGDGSAPHAGIASDAATQEREGAADARQPPGPDHRRPPLHVTGTSSWSSACSGAIMRRTLTSEAVT